MSKKEKKARTLKRSENRVVKKTKKLLAIGLHYLENIKNITRKSKKVRDISKKRRKYMGTLVQEVDYVNLFFHMYVFIFLCVVALRKLG